MCKRTADVVVVGRDRRSQRRLVQDAISDLVTNLLYYDRKEDQELPSGAIEELVQSGELDVATMVEWFRAELAKGLG